ncbi:MAG: GNAT family N-acetyltransferase [Phreatobacter sp.]|jgi:GNAT superfamily N-acetyltransferase|uniref:GNAT family N-acetyltransferase n=1 Tax=Phreatobacter sp. TaxID=1966341 RepID=UPI004035DF08
MSPFAWRPMTAADLPAVSAIAAEVHPDFPEDDAVFAERQWLYPSGCRVLAGAERLDAYVVSHPWEAGSCPPLNALLGHLPEPATTYYIHDIALLPAARGTGAAAEIVEALKAEARGQGLPAISLVAVNGSAGFWRRMGFAETSIPALAPKLASYGADARYMVCRAG